MEETGRGTGATQLGEANLCVFCVFVWTKRSLIGAQLLLINEWNDFSTTEEYRDGVNDVGLWIWVK